jgi:hypothetical protein
MTQGQLMATRDLTEHFRHLPWNGDAVLLQPGIEPLHWCIPGERNITADIKPGRIAGQPQLWKTTSCACRRAASAINSTARARLCSRLRYTGGLDHGDNRDRRNC